jgi:hypothetical protein
MDDIRRTGKGGEEDSEGTESKHQVDWKPGVSSQERLLSGNV